MSKNQKKLAKKAKRIAALNLKAPVEDSRKPKLRPLKVQPPKPKARGGLAAEA